MSRPTPPSPAEQPLRLVEVSGGPRERGQQHGAAARVQIERSIEYYSELFARDHGLDWATVVRRAHAWGDAVRDFDADLATEAEGIAEGAERSVDEILALNARGEMVYGGAPPEGCTSFAVLPEASSDGHTYIGQNWDWRHGARDTWIVLRIVQPPKPTVVTVVEAGQLGRYGTTSAGLGLFSNGLAGFWSRETAVPQPFIRRRILDSASIKDALELILGVRQQVSVCLLLGHRDGFAIGVETTPSERAWIYPVDGVFVHGNHYEALSGPDYRPYGADSLYRVVRVRDGIRRPPAGAASTFEVLDAALSDHFGFPDSVCAHPSDAVDPLDRWSTLSSTIVDLTSGRWWIAPGTPCEHERQPLPWTLYDDDPAA